MPRSEVLFFKLATVPYATPASAHWMAEWHKEVAKNSTSDKTLPPSGNRTRDLTVLSEVLSRFSIFLMPLRHLRRWLSGIRKLLKTALLTGRPAANTASLASCVLSHPETEPEALTQSESLKHASLPGSECQSDRDRDKHMVPARARDTTSSDGSFRRAPGLAA